MALPVAPLPAIRPMLTVPGALPDEHDEAEWGFEVKWDGVRCVVTAPGDGGIQLVSRTGNDVTSTYPELLELGMQLQGRPTILDGEIVAMDEKGRPDFGLLQRRMGITNPRRAAHLAMEYPIHLMLFDVMHVGGRSLMATPYQERRAVLAGMGLTGRSWSVPTHLAGHGHRAWDATLRHGYEGVIAKRLTSYYLPGVRSPDWRKVKHLLTLDVVIGGWTEGRGSLAGLPGAVLAGVDEPTGLRYVGSVGSGLSGHERRDLARYLSAVAREDSPFVGPVDVPGAHWVEPRLVAEVTLTGWTPAGHIRHPVWHRLRPDLTLPGW